MDDMTTNSNEQKQKIKIKPKIRLYPSRMQLKLGRVQGRLHIPLLRIGYGPITYRWKRTGLFEYFFGSFSVGVRNAMNPHIAIVGESGSGKSNACKVLVEQLCANGVSTVVLDPHGEYADIAGTLDARVYDASYNGINVFDLDGMDVAEKIADLGAVLKKVFRLGDVQSYMLHKVMRHMYQKCEEMGKRPSPSNLLLSVRTFCKYSQNKEEQKALRSLERRLSLLNTSTFAHGIRIEEVMEGRSVILLSNLRSSESQALYMEGLLRKIYTRMLASKKCASTRLYIVIDEAEKLEGSIMLGRLSAEGRKYGIGIVAIAQRAKAMPTDVRGNASIFISFYHREPEELNYVTNLIAGGNEAGRYTEVKKALRNLHRGSAVVQDARHREPLLVRFDRFRGGMPSLEHLITRLARGVIEERALIFQMQGMGFTSAEVREKMAEMTTAEDPSLSFYDFPHEPYKGRWYISGNHNSPEHDVCVHIISRHLTSKGISNRIHNTSWGPDIVAMMEGKRVAIEYETGKKNPEETRKMIASRTRMFQETIVMTLGNMRIKCASIKSNNPTFA